MFNLNLIRKDSLTKFLCNSSYTLPIIKNIKINFFLRNIVKKNKNVLLQSISLLDILIMQKPFIQILNIKQDNKMKQKNKIILFFLTLNKNKMFLFLKYLDICILSEMYYRHMFINSKLNINNYFFKINNISIFKHLDSYFFNWNNCLYLILNSEYNFIYSQFLKNNKI